MILVSVVDKKAEAFGPVFTSKNVAIATRDFSQACQDPQSNLNKFPEDYELILLGEFDETSGKIKPIEPHRIITTASNFVNKEDKCVEQK